MSDRQLTREQVRILQAARTGALHVNERGRYVISGQPRPDRKERERLLRWGYLWCGFPAPGREVLITATGRGALVHSEQGDMAR